jgi:hypothetical protein
MLKSGQRLTKNNRRGAKLQNSNIFIDSKFGGKYYFRMMRKYLFSMIGLALLLSVEVAAQTSSKIELPAAARRLLDKKYPGWKFPKVSADIRQYFKKSDAELNLVSGDFDGNGRADYALQIEHGVEFTDRGTSVPKSHLVVLMKNNNGYRLQIIDGGGDFIALTKKGDKGYNWETRKNFIFARDAIETVFFEKAATAYVYEKGKFRAIVTSD